MGFKSGTALLEKKQEAGSSIIDGVWFVSGDYDIPAGNMTEMWTGSEFMLGPTLPERMDGHCQVTINATHVFFANCDEKTTYLLNWNLQEWTQLYDMCR